MGIEEQIALRLQQGAAPRDLIAEGFRKSTVYKVLEALRPHQAPTPSPLLFVQLSTDRTSYPPGAAAQTSFVLTNHSATDLYVFQAGVRPEWLSPTEWIPTTVRKLLTPGDTMPIRLTLPIPADIELGEKELLFGVQGQWVGPQSTSPSTSIMWTNPLIIRVQRPRTGTKVFLSHSVFDMSWVSRLETTLEDNGVATEVAPTTTDSAPRQAIDAAEILVAVITDAVRLPAALQEIAYAQSRRKQLVLLRNRTLATLVPAELAALPWVDVDFSLGKATILMYLFNALQQSIEQRAATRKKEQEDALGAIILGLGALAVAVALAKGGKPTIP
jgi:TIR domain